MLAVPGDRGAGGSLDIEDVGSGYYPVPVRVHNYRDETGNQPNLNPDLHSVCPLPLPSRPPPTPSSSPFHPSCSPAHFSPQARRARPCTLCCASTSLHLSPLPRPARPPPLPPLSRAQDRDSVLVRRFLLWDNLSGRETDSGDPKVLRFASAITLRSVPFRRSFPPFLSHSCHWAGPLLCALAGAISAPSPSSPSCFPGFFFPPLLPSDCRPPMPVAFFNSYLLAHLTHPNRHATFAGPAQGVADAGREQPHRTARPRHHLCGGPRVGGSCRQGQAQRPQHRTRPCAR